MRFLFSFLAVLLGSLYLLNPTAGLFELLPDNLPVVGNLDEAAATALVLAGLRGLRRPKSQSGAQSAAVSTGVPRLPPPPA